MNPRILTLLLAAGLSTSGVHAQVTRTFDSDTGGFVDGADGTVAHSSYNGGSLAITAATGWKVGAAMLDLRADPEFWPELQQALINGGTLSYTIYIEPADVTGAPGYFESAHIGNSSGVWDQSFGPGKGLVGIYGAVNDPVVVNVSHPVEAGPAVDDSRVQFSGDTTTTGGYHQLLLGLNAGGGDFTEATFYIDDFTLEANESAVIEIPKLTLEPATQGLNLICLGTSQWDRRMIRTPNDFSSNSWVGETGAGPITYSFTIADYPQEAAFPALLYFIPEENPDYTDPDWQAASAFRLQIQRSTAGEPQCSAAVQYKVNAPGTNGQAGYEFWVGEPDPPEGLGGQLAYLSADQIIGTWSLSFSSDTDFTITAPDGATTSGSMLQSVADLFAAPLSVFLAVRPDAAGNVGLGLTAVFSRFTISGTPDEFDEDFTLAIEDSNGYYEPYPTDRTGVVVVTPTTPYWLRWTLPATGFSLWHAADFESGWTELDTTNVFTDPDKDVRYLLDEADILDPSMGFFQLQKPAPAE